MGLCPLPMDPRNCHVVDRRTPARTLQTVFTDQATAAARATGLIRRQGKLTAPAFVQGLTFGWLANPQATLEELAQAVTLAGSSLTPPALDQRFTPAAARC